MINLEKHINAKVVNICGNSIKRGNEYEAKEDTFTSRNIILISAFALTACGDDGECEVCNGTGYYNTVNCTMCDGSGYSDFDRSDIPIY